MKFLFATDSLKGTLSSTAAARLLCQAAQEVFDDAECHWIPMADGGEGTTEAILAATHGKIVKAMVHNPLGEIIPSYFGEITPQQALIEMAAASGLTLVPPTQRNPLHTTSMGTGELIKAAIDRQYAEIFISLGGSATNDGGMGCMQALGVRFLDAEGNELRGEGANLGKVVQVDASHLDKRIANTRFTVLCDVTNPLCGPHGATHTFAAQKGADEAAIGLLEKGMTHFQSVLESELQQSIGTIAGSGAAGGLGAALFAWLHAKPIRGVEAVLQLNHFDQLLENVDLVVTGEGRADEQSCYGKVIQGIASHCQQMGVPVIALVGSVGKGAEKLLEQGLLKIFTTTETPLSWEETQAHAQEDYLEGARRMFQKIKNWEFKSKHLSPARANQKNSTIQ